MMLNRLVHRGVTSQAKKVAKKAAITTAALTPALYYNSRRHFVKAEATTAVDHGGLNPADFVPLHLADVQPVSPDASIYYFNLPNKEGTLNMPCTSYVVAKANIEGADVTRPYTPLSELPGEMPLLVKHYPNGKMGGAFKALNIGDTMLFKGPLPKFQYKSGEFDKVTLIAGGTGITPVFQVIEHIALNNEPVNVHLVYANKTPDDILIKPLLDEMEYAFPDRIKITYVIDNEVPGWKGPTGFVTKDLLHSIIPAPDARHKVFVCGPPGMMQAVSGPKGPNYTQGEVGGALKELGFTEEQVFKF